MKVKIHVPDAYNKISAIRSYRWVTGLGLRDSKTAIEDIMQEKLGSSVMEFVQRRPYDIIVNSEMPDVEERIKACNEDTSNARDGVHCEIFKEEQPRRLELNVSIEGEKATIEASGLQIKATMTVHPYRLIETIEWITNNFLG